MSQDTHHFPPPLPSLTAKYFHKSACESTSRICACLACETTSPSPCLHYMHHASNRHAGKSIICSVLCSLQFCKTVQVFFQTSFQQQSSAERTVSRREALISINLLTPTPHLEHCLSSIKSLFSSKTFSINLLSPAVEPESEPRNRALLINCVLKQNLVVLERRFHHLLVT